MQFQYILVALLASANYVVAVPAADIQDTVELTSVPDGVSAVDAAQLVSAVGAPVQGIFVAHLILTVFTQEPPSAASARTAALSIFHGSGTIQHRVPWYRLENGGHVGAEAVCGGEMKLVQYVRGDDLFCFI
ncbi:hypothetical protein V498_04737 [Pseudogymnoascus sp. VKM F-4517 (FW-2822)]|nr:hypothetical protein V498_04737 [Pseudogymnoascus sp. VKM F-4517 (FW-2822)]